MNKILIGVLLIALVTGGVLFMQSNKGQQILQNPSSKVGLQTQNSSMVESTTVSDAASDTIRIFFQKIAKKEIVDAVLMMSTPAIADDLDKQAWSTQLNAFESVQIQSIEPSEKEKWTEKQKTYKVLLDVVMSDLSANALIPYYGYENGINTRWVQLQLEDGVWKIAAISTGP